MQLYKAQIYKNYYVPQPKGRGHIAFEEEPVGVCVGVGVGTGAACWLHSM